jgi:chromosome segregation ATPase
MSRFDEIRNIAKQEIEQRKREIERLETKITQLESDQKDLEDEMIVMLEWVEDLKAQQERLQQECEDLEAEIKEKKLPCSLLGKCAKVLNRMKAAKLNNKDEKD